MVLLIILGIIAIICVIIVSYDGNHKINIKVIEAGGRTNHNNGCSISVPMHNDNVIFNRLLMLNGKPLSSNHAVLVVDGDCMGPFNIHDGDYVVVRLFTWFERLVRLPKEQFIQKDDILYIVYKDNQEKNKAPRRKMRVFDGNITDDNKAKTYYFKDGKPKYSNTPHKLDYIKGIVKYKVDTNLLVKPIGEDLMIS